MNQKTKIEVGTIINTDSGSAKVLDILYNFPDLSGGKSCFLAINNRYENWYYLKNLNPDYYID